MLGKIKNHKKLKTKQVRDNQVASSSVSFAIDLHAITVRNTHVKNWITINSNV